jgi:hypothetical protein
LRSKGLGRASETKAAVERAKQAVYKAVVDRHTTTVAQSMAASGRMGQDMEAFDEALLRARRLSCLLEGREEEWVAGSFVWRDWVDAVVEAFARMEALGKALERDGLLVSTALAALAKQYRDPSRYAAAEGPSADATVYVSNPLDLLLGAKRSEPPPPTLSTGGSSSVMDFLLLFCRKDGYIWLEALTNVDRRFTQFKRAQRTAGKQLRRVEEARHVELRLRGAMETALRRLDGGGSLYGAFRSWKREVEAEKARKAYLLRTAAARAAKDGEDGSDGLRTPLLQQKLGGDGADNPGSDSGVCCCCCC